MLILPLAIYTADHGLAWNYPREEIGFAELDACRKALGGLPDFDIGEPGYEGVWVTASRVFVMCCQSAPKWDFRGRDATYLAVTWLSREEAKGVDFEALVKHAALQVPTKTPQTFFQIQSSGVSRTSFPGMPKTLSNGFAQVNSIIAQLSNGQTAKFKRVQGAQTVSCSYEMAVVASKPQSEFLAQSLRQKVEPQRSYAPALVMQPSVPMAEKTFSPLFIVMLVVLGISFALNVFLGYAYLQQRPEVKEKVTKMLHHSMKRESQTPESTEPLKGDATEAQEKDEPSESEMKEEVSEAPSTSACSNTVNTVTIEGGPEGPVVTRETTTVQEDVTVQGVTNERMQIEAVSSKVLQALPRQNDHLERHELLKRMGQLSVREESLSNERE